MDYNLIIDIENRRLVAGFDSTEAGAPPAPVFGDQPTVNVQLVEPNHNDADNPWRAVTLTGQSIRVGVGSLADATPSAYIELTDDLAGASATITEIRAGVLNTTNELQRVQILDALAGNYTLTIAGETTNSIALDASLDTIKCELEGLASITSDSVSITGSSTDFNVEFASSLADVGAITVNLDNITSRVGKTGTLDLHVEEILTLLDGETSVEATIEIVRWTTADVAGETVLQVPVTVSQDVIPDTVPSTTPLPGYATIDLDHINQSGAATGQIPTWNGTEWVPSTVSGTGDLLSTANLSDLADIPTARTNLGLGTAATTDATDYATSAQGTLADSALQSADIDTLAELNAIVGDATLDSSSDARTPTAHTHTASDIDAEASTDGYVLTSDGAGNAAWEASTGGSGHDPVTVTDSAEIDFTLVGQDITASLIASSIDETKLDASTNASLDLADSASQPGHTHTASDIDAEASTDGYVLTSDGAGNAAWEASTGGGGNVTKVGTPVDNQVGVWTGDGTIEGDANFTWSGTDFYVEGNTQICSLDTGSGASPELSLKRDSASPADGDYLGQIRFDGKNDTGGNQLYAKITGKTSDVTNGTEDGLIETAVVVDGTNTIVSRQTGDALKLINNVSLEVAGDITVTGTVDGVDVGDRDHDAVTLAGSPNYITKNANQQLTLHDVDLTSEVTGDLPVADGGTGASDAATARTNLGVQSVMGFALSDETSALTTGQKIATDMPVSMNVKRVYASVGTAGGTSAITIDVEDEGVTILNAVVSISAGANNAETSTFTGAASNYQLTKGDALTIDVDSIDDGTANGLKVYLIGDITA